MAVIIGYPTLKLRKDYFSLITFGFGEAVAALLNFFDNLTGGSAGMAGIPRRTDLALVLISTIVIIWLVRNFKYSSYGRMCIALKNDDLAAKSFGINVFKLKMKVFVVSAIIATYAGVLYAFFTRYIEPAMFGWTHSAEWVIIVFFGGMNSLTGAVVSSILLTALPEALRFAAEYRIAIYCILIIFILNFRTKGVFGEYEINLKSFKNTVAFVHKMIQHKMRKGGKAHENTGSR
ncbi:MAG: branched-chain amino acid ABC transporter permease, partial [Dethiobacter sp.]|nr:branched-chain amino acid ABC transporter permease [Dethiobacter sp.]